MGKKPLFFVLSVVVFNLSLAEGMVDWKESFQYEIANGITISGQTAYFEDNSEQLSNLILYKALQTDTVDRWQRDQKKIIEKCKVFGHKHSEYSGFEYVYSACVMDAYADFNRNTRYLEKKRGKL